MGWRLFGTYKVFFENSIRSQLDDDKAEVIKFGDKCPKGQYSSDFYGKGGCIERARTRGSHIV